MSAAQSAASAGNADTAAESAADTAAEAAESGERFAVVSNEEEQYSIWWVGRELPAGWQAEGTEGTREECLARINEIWTDLRPLSLRRRMAEAV